MQSICVTHFDLVGRCVKKYRNMSPFTILFFITAAYDVFGDDKTTSAPADSHVAESGGFVPVIASRNGGGYELDSAAHALSSGPVNYGASGPALIAAPSFSSVAGSSAPLNNAAAVGAAQLSAIQNAQAVQAAQIANAAAAAIQGARVAEAAARAGQAHAIKKAQAYDASRIANLHRARLAAFENARAAEAAKRAAAAAAIEVARAMEADRIANAARVHALAIANARAIEAARIANAARAQASAVATSAAQAQAVAEAVARNSQDGPLAFNGGLLNTYAANADGYGYGLSGYGSNYGYSRGGH